VWALFGVGGVGGRVAAAAAILGLVLVLVGAPLLVQTPVKLVCAASLGFFLARVVQLAVEMVVIAVVIAVSDVVSVLRGPTAVIAAHHRSLLDALSLEFHALGGDGVSSLGMTDVVFFAGFLAVAARLGLRVRATWLAMTASLCATSVIAFASGRLMPALPLLAVAAVAVNADRLWAAHRRQVDVAG
jgi:hypothetical protein